MYLLRPPLICPQTGHWVGMYVLIVSTLDLSTDGILGGNVCTYCVHPCFVHRRDTVWECLYLLCPPLICPQTGHWVGMYVLIVSTLDLSTGGTRGGSVCTYCVHRRDTGWECVYLLCPQTGHGMGMCVLIVSTDGTRDGNVCTYCVHTRFVNRRDTGWECVYLLCPPLLFPQMGHGVGMYVLIVSTDGILGGNVCTYCVHPWFVHRWDTGWECLYLLCPPLLCLQTGHWVGTILLSTCQLLQRPSKKEGYCFKLFHPLDQSIWATKVSLGVHLV